MKPIFDNLTRASLNMKHAIHDIERVLHDSNPDRLEDDDIKLWELAKLQSIRDVLSAHNSQVDRMLEGLIERMEDRHEV